MTTTNVKKSVTPKKQPKKVNPPINDEQKEAQREANTQLEEALESAVPNVENIFTLFAGYTDGSGNVHKEVEMREMTGADEEYLSGKPEFKTNNAKFINAMLARLIVRIGDIEKSSMESDVWMNSVIKQLYVGDQDSLIFAIKSMNQDQEFKSKCVCPHCNTDLTIYLDKDDFIVIPFSGETEDTFELPKGYFDKSGKVHKEFKVRVANGEDRELLEPIMKKNVAKGSSMMIQRLCKFTDGYPLSNDVVRDMTTRDRDAMRTAVQSLEFGYDGTVNVDCAECGENITVQVDQTNF